METLFIYLLKSSGLIAVFYLAYHFLVRKETFFTSNRWFLITGLFTSLLLPLFTITKVVYVERPKIALEDLVAYTNATATTQAIPVAETIDWMLMLGLLYGIVSGVLLLKIVVDFVSLYKIISKQQVIVIDNFKLVNLNKNISPFSFFSYIVYNPNLYTQDELNSILLHEKIHSQEKHSIDIIVAKLFCVVFWCNPFVWLYKKAITQNLEYIADHKAINQLEDKKSYQKALLKIVSTPDCLSVTNNFYQSLIKKRIVMLNKNQSHQRNSLKYALVIPALIGFIFLFQIKVEAQTKATSEKYTTVIVKETNPLEIAYVFDKISSDNELKKDALAINSKYNINFKFDKVKRNAQGEIIAIKISYNDKKGNKGKVAQSRTIPIRPIFFKISKIKDGEYSFGFYDNPDLIEKPVDEVNEKKITTIESIEDDAIIFVDGERYSKEDLNYLDPKGLESISIVTDKASMQKYGVTDKDKIIVIETNWSTKSKAANSKDASLLFSNPFSELASKKPITDFNDVSTINFNEPLMILDGKEIDKRGFEMVNPNSISNVKVLKTTEAMEKYGERAKNGVIEIQTIDYYEKNNSIAKSKAEVVDFKINTDNNGFIITKSNDTAALEFYQSILAKNKINFSFDKVKRDKNGLITAISITLENSEDKISKAFKNKNGIEDIFIGKEKGVLVIR